MDDTKKKLDGNTFLIVNKEYYHAKLAQWGSEPRKMGTYELEVSPDQFWLLEEDSKYPGFYYIKNVKWEGYRLAKFGEANEQVGSYNGQYASDQMWKFVQVEGDYYRIYNYAYPNARLTKFGKGDTEWGTYTGDYYEDQVWKLVPRFKASVSEDVLWSADNRQGTQDFSEEITITTGLTLSSSRSISTTTGFEASLTASVSYLVVSAEVSMAVSSQIENSLSQSSEKTWSTQQKVTFTAPKGKNYRVKQIRCDFESPLASDNCALGCDYKVEQTDGEFPN